VNTFGISQLLSRNALFFIHHFSPAIVARLRQRIKIQGGEGREAKTDAGIPGGMLRDVSEYTLEIQPLTQPQQMAGEKCGLPPSRDDRGEKSGLEIPAPAAPPGACR